MQRARKIVAYCGIMVAASILLGKVCSITAGAVRLSLENLPVLMAGVCFGPIAGAMVGVTADLLGSILVGFSINPIVTLGAGAVGLMAGIVYNTNPLPKDSVRPLRGWPLERPPQDGGLFWSVMLAHLVGSVIIKTVGLVVYHYATWQIIFYRVPVYIVTAVVEYYLLKRLIPAISSLTYTERSGRP